MLDFTDKQTARKYFLGKRLAKSDAVRQSTDAVLCRKIMGLAKALDAHTLLLYYPVKNEINLLPLASEALKLGLQVAFPISQTETLTLDFRRIGSPEELHTGAYGICEPSQNAPLPLLDSGAMCVVPALAYDKRGYRLGYGKGYYDRFLKDFSGTSVGAVASDLLLDSLPTNQTDIAVDIIITETGVIRPNESSFS